MTALLTSFGLVALAEMADKTQLLTLCLTCRYPARKVLLGVALSVAVLNLLAVALGGAIGHLLPVDLVRAGAGLLFVGFGIWTIWTVPSEEDEACETSTARSPVIAVALAFFVAELGDKTQLATLSLAARFSSLLPVWLGATAGMIAANGLAIGGGTALARRIPESTLRRLAGALFVLFGALTLLSAFS